MTSFNISEKKIQVIYPGYDPKQFNTLNHDDIRTRVRASLNIPKDMLVIGFITSGDFKKRAFDLFIEALHALQTEVVNRGGYY